MLDKRNVEVYNCCMFDSSDRPSVAPDGMIVTMKDIADDSHHCSEYRSYICDDENKGPTREFFDIDIERFASRTQTTTYACHFVRFKEHQEQATSSNGPSNL